MSLFMKLLALVKAAMPLPAFSDLTSVTTWLTNLAPAEADLIVSLVGQFKSQGFVEIELPNGNSVRMTATRDGRCMSGYDQAMLAGALANADPKGMGNWLEALQKIIALIPALLEIIAIFTVEPSPTPDPDPAPQPPIV